VEVKIGVQFAPRELVLESTQSPTEVEQAVADAFSAHDWPAPGCLDGKPSERAHRVL
jgi:hypothetical protein